MKGRKGGGNNVSKKKNRLKGGVGMERLRREEKGGMLLFATLSPGVGFPTCDYLMFFANPPDFGARTKSKHERERERDTERWVRLLLEGGFWLRKLRGVVGFFSLTVEELGEREEREKVENGGMPSSGQPRMHARRCG